MQIYVVVFFLLPTVLYYRRSRIIEMAEFLWRLVQTSGVAMEISLLVLREEGG